MLIGNYSVMTKHPGTHLGGSAAGIGMNPTDGRKSSMARARFATLAGYSPKSSTPDGYRMPYAWVWPKKAGTLSSRGLVFGTGASTASGAMGKNGAATIAGVGDFAGTGALIVSALATIAGTGTIDSASAVAFVNAVAAIEGTSTYTAVVDALGWMIGAPAGVGAMTGTRYATGELAADLTLTTSDTLTADQVAQAVWQQAIESGYTAEDILRVLAAVSAGKVSGAGTTTITIRDLADTTDRIVATVDATGNRSAVTLDVAS